VVPFRAYDTILFMATWHLAGSLHYIEQQLEHHQTRTFQEEYLTFLNKTRRTFRRKIPLGLGAPDHPVPYGTVPFQGTLPQALRARLRSVCPYGTRLQPFCDRLQLALTHKRGSATGFDHLLWIQIAVKLDKLPDQACPTRLMACLSPSRCLRECVKRGSDRPPAELTN
jgi:hypothetical protein